MFYCGARYFLICKRLLNSLRSDLQVNWMGTSVFVFYICAFGFYLWIRISKTLDLGQYLPYGIFVLFVECMGATTVVLYGTNLLWNPVNEIVLQESEDGIGPGKLKVMMHLHRETAVLIQGALRPQFWFDFLLPFPAKL